MQTHQSLHVSPARIADKKSNRKCKTSLDLFSACDAWDVTISKDIPMNSPRFRSAAEQNNPLQKGSPSPLPQGKGFSFAPISTHSTYSDRHQNSTLVQFIAVHHWVLSSFITTCRKKTSLFVSYGTYGSQKSIAFDPSSQSVCHLELQRA